MLKFDRKQQNSVKQLSFNLKMNKLKKNLPNYSNNPIKNNFKKYITL